MKPLTLEHAINSHFTPTMCVKYFKPDWTDEQCDHYIWEHTCFPNSNDIMIKQLNEKFLNEKA